MKRLAHVILLLGLVLSGPAAAESVDLSVTVDGLRSDKGHVHFGLYDKADKFPSRAGVITTGRATIQGGRAVYVFHDLAPGRYALSVFHDENDNGKFDRSMIGLPLEGYGFSNDAKVMLSPPSFKDAAFAVGDAGASVTITIVY
jgi:uncharacterized protein (DUF2141 family)